MRKEPWDGRGPTPATKYGDQCGRAWKHLVLTTRAEGDGAARFERKALRAAVLKATRAFPHFWRSGPWGRKVRDEGRRAKRVRRDTSAVRAVEIAPGGMVHIHVLVYGEFVEQKLLGELWGRALGMEGQAIVHVKAVDSDDVAGGIREVIKYATKGQGGTEASDVDRAAERAAAVEYSLRQIKRIVIMGALRKIMAEDMDGADYHGDVGADELEELDRATVECGRCGSVGEWKYQGPAAPRAVADNGGWGRLHWRAPP